jgi:hypothetical protein
MLFQDNSTFIFGASKYVDYLLSVSLAIRM